MSCATAVIVETEIPAAHIIAMGIDEEQAALDRATTSSNAAAESGTQRTQHHLDYVQGAAGTMAADTATHQPSRPTRSSRLSQLPRLGSSRLLAVGGKGLLDADAEGRRRGSAGEQSAEEPPPSDDETIYGQDRDEEGDNETETDTDLSSGSEEDTSGMPGFLPSPVTGRRPSRVSIGAASEAGRESRRPSEIALPPAPSFSHLEQPDIAASTATQVTGKQPVSTALQSDPAHASDAPAEAPVFVGRDSWTQFGDETPSWLPTPRAMNEQASARSVVNGSFATPSIPLLTPLAGQASGEMSYFNISPAPAQDAVRGRGDKTAPPPSPSIITRSRAQSSASNRSIGRTPTIPMRDLPPMPPVAPLNLRGTERARSPNRGKVVSPVPLIVTSPSNSVLVRSTPPSRKTTGNSTPRPSTSNALMDGVASTSSPPPNAKPEPALGAAGQPSLRPGLYQQQSRSLIDLTSSSARKKLEPTLKPVPLEANPLDAGAKDALPHYAPSEPSAPSCSLNLRRRRSMFEVGAAPPPYSTAQSRLQGLHLITPREEEGRETLPDYMCTVHIEGYLPRKMEFSAPGVQAKDRSWRRQYFILHGTCLRVYRTDLSREGAAAKGDYGRMHGAHVHLEPMNEDGPTLPPANGTTSRIQASERNTNIVTKDSYLPSPTIASSNASVHTSNESTSSGNGSGGSLQRTVEAALSGTISHINHPFSSHKGALLKQYTLQDAESGLAADYLKRRHVVRVRTEGEQFLLQTRNDRHVVDWIEALQASTNIALDLERRPMPKFITLPRRRRRRRRDATGTDASAAAAAPASAERPAADGSLASREAAELAEARRRSLAEAGRPSGSTRAHPPRPLGLPGDESPPNPSAAFEEMLREEHEQMSRQDAGDV